MGKPLISSSFSGLKENVLDGINGFVVQPGNVSDLVFAMKRFLEMKQDTLKRFSERAREYALNNFDVSTQKRKHCVLYDRITACGME